jgi:hypothetical protein
MSESYQQICRIAIGYCSYVFFQVIPSVVEEPTAAGPASAEPFAAVAQAFYQNMYNSSVPALEDAAASLPIVPGVVHSLSLYIFYTCELLLFKLHLTSFPTPSEDPLTPPPPVPPSLPYVPPYVARNTPGPMMPTTPGARYDESTPSPESSSGGSKDYLSDSDSDDDIESARMLASLCGKMSVIAPHFSFILLR